MQLNQLIILTKQLAVNIQQQIKGKKTQMNRCLLIYAMHGIPGCFSAENTHFHLYFDQS